MDVYSYDNLTSNTLTIGGYTIAPYSEVVSNGVPITALEDASDGISLQKSLNGKLISHTIKGTAAQQASFQSMVSSAGNLILDGASVGTGSLWVQFAPNQRIAYALDSGTTATTASVDYSFDGVTPAGQAFTISYASSTVFEIGTLLVSAYFVALALAAKRAGTFKGYFFKVTVLTGGPLSVYNNI